MWGAFEGGGSVLQGGVGCWLLVVYPLGIGREEEEEFDLRG